MILDVYELKNYAEENAEIMLESFGTRDVEITSFYRTVTHYSRPALESRRKTTFSPR